MTYKVAIADKDGLVIKTFDLAVNADPDEPTNFDLIHYAGDDSVDLDSLQQWIVNRGRVNRDLTSR